MDPDGLVSRLPCGVGARWFLPLLIWPPPWGFLVLEASPWEPPGRGKGRGMFTGFQLKPPLAGLAAGRRLLHTLPECGQVEEAQVFLSMAKARLG